MQNLCVGSTNPAEHGKSLEMWINEYFILLRYGAGDGMACFGTYNGSCNSI